MSSLNKILYASVLFFTNYLVSAQCPDNTLIQFSSQIQIDQFGIDYPNCDSLISIEILNNISNLDPLKGVKNLGTLIIRDNPNLDILWSVNIANSLVLTGNGTLSSIDSLNLNREMVSIILRSNPTLSGLEPLTNVENVGHLIILNENPNINYLDKFDSLTVTQIQLLGEFEFDNFNKLFVLSSCDFWGIPSLNSFSQILNTFSFDVELDRLSFINSNLNSIDGSGTFYFDSADSLKYIRNVIFEYPILDLGGFKDSDVNVDIFQIHSSDITNLDDLNTLNPEVLELDDNDQLQSLEGMVNLSNLKSFTFTDNDILEDISLLSTVDILEPGFYPVHIEGNPLLRDCDVESICEMLMTDYNPVTVIINNNDTDCNSIEEVEDDCLSDLSENLFFAVDVFPNPTTNDLNILNPDLKKLDLRVYDLLGKEVLYENTSDQRTQINLVGLPKQTYILKIIDSNSGIYSAKKIIIE